MLSEIVEVEKEAVKRAQYLESFPPQTLTQRTNQDANSARGRLANPMTMRTDYLLPCILNPIQNCALWGGIFVGIDVLQGSVSTTSPPSLLRNFGLYAGGLWCYRASMCPMEIIHGRQSLLQ
jgi:hypothetical protein